MTDDIQRRIADVLRQYRWAISDERGPQRVAEEIVKELGLTQEEQSVYDHAEPFATAYEHRYVTDWERADTEEEAK